MHHWRKLVVDVAAAVGKVVWLTGLKIEVVVDWRNVSLVLVRRVVSDRHMLRPRLARRWIREFIGRWNVVEGLLGAGGRRLERNKIIIWRFLQIHGIRTRLNSRRIDLNVVVRSFSPYTIRIDVRLKCDIFVIFQFQSTRCGLRRFCCWVEWSCLGWVAECTGWWSVAQWLWKKTQNVSKDFFKSRQLPHIWIVWSRNVEHRNWRVQSWSLLKANEMLEISWRRNTRGNFIQLSDQRLHDVRFIKRLSRFSSHQIHYH